MNRFAICSLLPIVLLGGCGPGGNSDCIPLSEEKLSDIGEGLKLDAELLEGYAVALPEEDQAIGVKYAAAIDLDSDGDSALVVLGISDPEPVSGVTIAADDVARMYFTWGEATEEGSPAAEFRDWLKASDHARTAKKCISGS